MDNNISSVKSFNQDARNLNKSSDKQAVSSSTVQSSEVENKHKTSALEEPISVTSKKILNASILESALNFEGTIANQPQALLLKTALEGINESLKELGVEKTVEQSADEGIDVSPQATADRIVAFSTNLLPLYLKQNPEMSEEEGLAKFMDVIGGGIDNGFEEAREVLGGLNVLEGEIASNIDKTYELVQQGLADFVENYSSSESSSDDVVSE